MKNKLIAGFAALMLALGALPASAQTDPTADAILAQILANQIAQTSQQTAALPKDILTESHLMDQVTQMIKDHVNVSDILKGLGSDLVSSINKNNDLMYNTTNTDQTMNDEYKRIVPKYRPDQDYLEYMNTLQKNSYQAYAQALGVANDGVSISKSSIAKKVSALLNEPPQNQLQALQQLVTIGHMQVQQMDKLIKIQAAMMKSMAINYQQNQGANGSVPSGAVTTMAARAYCASIIPFYHNLNTADKAEAFAKCKASLDASQAAQNAQ